MSSKNNGNIFVVLLFLAVPMAYAFGLSNGKNEIIEQTRQSILRADLPQVCVDKLNEIEQEDLDRQEDLNRY